MAIPVRDLKEWLDGLPEDAEVGIDSVELRLQIVRPPQYDPFDAQAYCEVGGMPEQNEWV